MFISNAFKNDTLSRNTKIVPVIIIEKLISDNNYKYTGFSTSNIELTRIEETDIGVEYKRMHFKPLLLGLPKLKESIDVTNGKYKISSVNLNLSNVEYNGSRISDLFTNNLLINENVSIHLKSQSCTTITPDGENIEDIWRDNDCAVVYVGKIRSVSHTDEKVTIRLEDLTEQKIHRDLPSVILADDESIIEKYKNKPIPMVYGQLSNAPLVAEYRNSVPTFMFDYKEIHSVKEQEYISPDDYDSDAYYNYGALKVFEDRYVPLLRNIKWVFVTEQWIDDGQQEPNEEYVPLQINDTQYYINDDNTISIEPSGLWLVDRLQGIYSGKPKAIDLIDTNLNTVAEDASGYTYGSETFDNLGMWSLNFLLSSDNDVNYNNMTDSNVDTFAQASDTQASFVQLGNPTGSDVDWAAPHYMTFNLPYILRWEFAPPSAKYSRLIGTSINGNKLPVRGDEDFDFNGRWGSTKSVLWTLPIPLINKIMENSFNIKPGYYGGHTYGWDWFNDRTAQETNSIVEYLGMWGTYGGLYDTFTMSAKHGLDEPTESSSLMTQVLRDIGVSYDWNDNAPIKFKTIVDDDLLDDFSISDPASHYTDCIPTLRFYYGNQDGWMSNYSIPSPDNYYCIDFIGLQIYSHDDNMIIDTPNMFSLDVKINEIDNFSLSEYDGASKKSYYADVTGRVDAEILNYNHTIPNPNTSYLENPIDIMRHILKEELGITKFNEEEYEEAWLEHYGWQFAFSVNKKINSKKLIEEISSSTMSFPRLKNNGEFGFVTIKKTYSVEEYWNDAIKIELEDIIKYDFKLSDPNKVISKLDFQYGYDAGEDRYLKTITADEFTEFEGQLNPATSNDTLLGFNGIEDVEDNKITLENKHIQSVSTAQKFIYRKFYNEKIQHLIVNLTLPLQYSEIEVGALIKFPKDKLIDGIRAYGMDYTNPILHGTVIRYPLFLITDVQRGLDSLSISCYQLHHLLPTHIQSETIGGGISMALTIPSGWGENNFPNGDWDDPVDFIESDEENIGFTIEPFSPAITPFYFLIGYDSHYNIDGVEYPSAYSRTFRITDPEIATNQSLPFNDQYYYNLIDGAYGFSRFESLFGLSRFDIDSWDALIPEKNSDGSGYGNIQNGGGINNVGQYRAMEIRMRSKNNVSWYILSLRNIAETIFDPDTFTLPTIPDNLVSASTENLKLGWVLYKSNEDWDYVSLNNAGENIDSSDVDVLGQKHNLDLICHAWTDDFDSELGWENLDLVNTHSYEHTMILYPNLNPSPNLKLQYIVDWSAEIYNGDTFGSNFNLGDLNFDQVVDILDLVILVNSIMNDEYNEGGDMNQDEILDIIDVISLINLIQEDT